MRITLSLGGNAAASLRQEGDALIVAAAGGVADATASLEQTLRRQVVGAGLGQRLAGTWRSQVFPPTATGAAGEVWTVGPLIIQGFDDGATIIARNGSRWLAIPTAAVPPRSWGSKAPGGHPRRLMTPVEVEAHLNRDLRMVQPPGSPVAYLIMDQLVAARSGRGFRQATPRRLAQGRSAGSILMFVLVPQVTLAKRLDIAGAVAAVEAEFPGLIESHFSPDQP
ncbi:MAG: DUF6441 family protein [Rhodospirillaceae bacterium]